MADPKQFPAALNYAYAVICVVVCGVGGVGYWYWGDAAQVRPPPLCVSCFSLEESHASKKWPWPALGDSAACKLQPCLL